MNVAKLAIVVGAKLNHPPGLRFFSSMEQAQRIAEGSIVTVGGFPAVWVSGPIPDDATLAAWEAEYDEAIEVETKRQEAIKALSVKLLEDALNDPNAPQAVKDYKAAKKL